MHIRTIFSYLRRPQPHPLRWDSSGAEPPLIFSLLLAFFTVSFFTQLGVRLEFLGAVRHELLLGVVLLCMSAVAVMTNPVDLSSEQPLLIGIAALAMAMVLQIPFAVDPDAASNTFMEWIIKFMLFFCFIVALIRSPRMLFGIVVAWIFSMFWIYQEAVRGLISGNLMWRNQGILRLHGAVPLYFHPNGLSLAACMSLPFIFNFLPVFRRTRTITLFLLVTAVFAGLCIVNTGSRAGYVGVLALIPFWIFDGRGWGKRLAIALLAAAVLLPLMPEQYKDRFRSIGGEEQQGRSREARIQILKDAWVVFQMYPFGTGIEGFQVVRQDLFGAHQDTHNLYAQIATHLGIQGLLAFGLFVATMYLSLNKSIQRLENVRMGLHRHVRNREGPDLRRGAAGFDWELSVVLATARSTRMLLYFMLFNGLFAHTMYHVVWWFLAGLTLACAGISYRFRKIYGIRSRQVLSQQGND